MVAYKQYLESYFTVSLPSMAATFGVSQASVESLFRPLYSFVDPDLSLCGSDSQPTAQSARKCTPSPEPSSERVNKGSGTAPAGERRLPGSRAERPRGVRAAQLQDRQGAPSPLPLVKLHKATAFYH